MFIYVVFTQLRAMSDADVWCIIQHCCTWARSDKETGGRRFAIVVHFLPRYHLLGCVTGPFKKATYCMHLPCT